MNTESKLNDTGRGKYFGYKIWRGISGYIRELYLILRGESVSTLAQRGRN